jgi:hypothetical protein
VRIALTALVCGLVIAACGSSVNPSKAAPKSYGQALDFSRCMRSHGLSNFPDPSRTGHGIQLSAGPSSGVNPQSPAFQQAQQACKHLLPGGGQPSAQASAQAKAHLLHISECMRAHGISGFPDPHSGSPPSSPAGYSAVFGTPGGYLAIPSSINVSSPAFKQAASACNFGPRGGVPKPR